MVHVYAYPQLELLFQVPPLANLTPDTSGIFRSIIILVAVIFDHMSSVEITGCLKGNIVVWYQCLHIEPVWLSNSN